MKVREQRLRNNTGLGTGMLGKGSGQLLLAGAEPLVITQAQKFLLQLLWLFAACDTGKLYGDLLETAEAVNWLAEIINPQMAGLHSLLVEWRNWGRADSRRCFFVG